MNLIIMRKWGNKMNETEGHGTCQSGLRLSPQSRLMV